MKLTTPTEFITTSWKNGKGQTIELAINEQGTLADFDWRISMAGVTGDGTFSDFTGYTRCLVLVEGSGIQLSHMSAEGQATKDQLGRLLDMAQFDGGNQTLATLVDGPITDFNIMTRTGTWHAITRICRAADELTLINPVKTFVYAVMGETQLRAMTPESRWSLPQGHLMQVEAGEFAMLAIKSPGCIVVELHPIAG
ncbi:HutD family protein [Granulosicoccus antarcticus]|uniref:Protein Ves n=1 Tax=Granulosicoccus antarcticus IMCC3135 TaxID=1192854 RepID=A0A2Z2NS08_9GAMM|nr:HutD family protein [Granulosicoccus antarcticus]ASJ74316.1 Protein Ves [Granulosicoccus antarcticus IMCC3135]